MKKIILPILTFTFLLCFVFAARAQSGIIATVAGTGTSGYSGDGGFAVAANLTNPNGVTADANGNFYIIDNNTIRKVSPAGIITRVAGNGLSGYSGDGGPATAAGISIGSSYIDYVAADRYGNIFIMDENNRIRKVNSSGIITTIAGNGTPGISGDGGPATNAQIQWGPITIDNFGNIYLAEYNNTIRKINSSGIITTIAGNGSMGFSGDGGPATAATFHKAMGMATDQAGNLYVADSGNGRIRMINPSGLITTVAGGLPGSGSSGDGGLALSASINGPFAVA